MTSYVVSIEGQSIGLPPEAAAKDEDVKRALAPYFPEITNALLTRTEKDDVVTITVVKRAGSKGSWLDHLAGCQGGKNPAVVLYEEIAAMGPLDQADPVEILGLQQRIDDAIREGDRQNDLMSTAVKRLASAASYPAPVVVEGF